MSGTVLSTGAMAVKTTKSLSHGIYIFIGSVAEGKEEEEKNKKLSI